MAHQIHRVAAWLAASMISLNLMVGCTPTTNPTPTTPPPTTPTKTATPTPTPSPTPTESANKQAARNAAVSYLDFRDRAISDPNVPIQDYMYVAIEQAAAGLTREILDTFREKHILMTGHVEYRDMVVPEPTEVNGAPQAVVTFCSDSSQAQFIDADGKPVFEDRYMTYTNQLTVAQQPNGKWLATYHTNQEVPC